MPSLEPRIAALEKASPAPEGMVIIRRFVSPGHLDAPILCLRSDTGEEWTRQPGETEQELIDRASREVKRNQWGVASLSTGAE
jgi:hypothetical protein